MPEGLGYNSLRLGSPKSNALERKSGRFFIMNKRRQLIPEIKMEKGTLRKKGGENSEMGRQREDGESYRQKRKDMGSEKDREE